MEKIIRISEAAKLLGVCIDTLRDWDQQGKLKPIRTLGKHRRYRLSEIEALLGIGPTIIQLPKTVTVEQVEKLRTALLAANNEKAKVILL